MRPHVRFFTLLFLITAAIASAQQGPASHVRSLKGIRGMQVVVEPPSEKAREAGLTTARLTTDVELRLRQSGVRVLTPEETLETPGRPFLYVSLNAIPEGPLITYSMHVHFKQVVVLHRDPSVILPAVSTWHKGSLGRTNVEGVRQALRDLIDIFLNDYLKANPKE